MSWPRSVGAGRVLCVAQTMVYVLHVLSEVAPEWVERYGERLEHEQMPKEEDERKQYANQVGADGWTLLHAASCCQYIGLVENAPRHHDAAHQSSNNSLSHAIKTVNGALSLHSPQPN